MTTQIRPAAATDVPTVVAMAERFLRDTPYGAQLTSDPDRLAGFARRLLENPAGALYLAERDGAAIGMIALWTYEHPYSGDRIASELVWWVNPEHRGSAGVRLLRRAEAWAKAQGARALQMIAPSPRVAGFYEACGYEWVESSYQRSVQ